MGRKYETEYVTTADLSTTLARCHKEMRDPKCSQAKVRSKEPNLPILCLSEVRPEMKRCDMSICTISLHSINHHLNLVVFKEELRFRGILREVNEEDVS